MELFNLSGKRALITGSTKGIGEAIAKRFAEHGAKVVISSRKEDMCIKIRDEINNKFPDSAISIPCNINEKKQLENLVKETNSIFGGIDILISNAGTATGGSIAEVSDEILRKSFEDNFFSHQYCASEATKIMKLQNNEGCLLFCQPSLSIWSC